MARRTRSRRLFVVAFGFGLATSVYWTFAVDLIRTEGGAGGSSGPLFWTVVGALGIAGGLVGHAVARLGLGRVLPMTLLGSAVATGLLAAAPAATPAVLASAALFSACFIAVTGTLGVWSVALFHDRPSAGFGTMFFLMVGGQVVGPAVMGALADLMSLQAVFWAAAAVTTSLSAVRPGATLAAMAGAARH